MKRYLFAAIVVALLAASCSGTSDAAATVNGVDIDASAVQELFHETTEELDSEQFVQVLDRFVQFRAFADAAKAELGIDPTEEEIDAEVDRIYAEGGLGATFEEFLETTNVSEEGLRFFATEQLVTTAVVAQISEGADTPTEEEALQVLADDPYNWTQVCAAHILVATEEEASSVLDRLETGEEFAAVAIELSLDTGSGAAGGDLGCTVPSQYVGSFADATMTAAIGEVVGPVESQFGLHLIRVDSRTEATVEELQAGLMSEVINDWFISSVTAAEVTVDEEHGTWQTEPFPGIIAAATGVDE